LESHSYGPDLFTGDPDQQYEQEHQQQQKQEQQHEQKLEQNQQQHVVPSANHKQLRSGSTKPAANPISNSLAIPDPSPDIEWMPLGKNKNEISTTDKTCHHQYFGRFFLCRTWQTEIIEENKS
jgi:hypothetical protein